MSNIEGQTALRSFEALGAHLGIAASSANGSSASADGSEPGSSDTSPKPPRKRKTTKPDRRKAAQASEAVVIETARPPVSKRPYPQPKLGGAWQEAKLFEFYPEKGYGLVELADGQRLKVFESVLDSGIGNRYIACGGRILIVVQPMVVEVALP